VLPRYPFGHGLSYTSFAYSNLTVDAASAAPSVRVSFAVQNTGAAVGKEVAQLYLAFPAAAGEPPLVLRDFAALPLAPGEAATVEFVLDSRDYSVWNVAAYAWEPAAGEYGVAVGASSRDIRLRGAFVPAQAGP
jgi:beta-glucosidase